VVVVTGGYSATGDPNDTFNYDASAKAGRSLFILDAKTGTVLAEKKFDPLALDAQKDMLYAIPTTPAVFDSDGDGYADLIYAGDLGGNVWKWVISTVGEDRVNDGTGLRTQPSWPFRRVFNAPSVKIGPDLYYKSFFTQVAGTLNGNDIWLAVGSGERANLTFEGVSGNSGENNRLYVVVDSDPFEIQSPAVAMVT
jgi:type IV pilus assembly protein PilY1